MCELLRLREVEQLIHQVASRFKIESHEPEDLWQIGRMAVWRVATKYGITAENMANHRGLLWNAVKGDLRNEYWKSRAAIRSPAVPILPLDAELGQVLSRHQGKGDYFEDSTSHGRRPRTLAETLSTDVEDHQLAVWACDVRFTRAVGALRRALKKTKIHPKNYPKLLVTTFFLTNNLTGPLTRLFKHDRFAYLDAAFPGQYYPWELMVIPKDYFRSDENVISAVRWMVEKKLGIPMGTLTKEDVWDQRISTQITTKTFMENELKAVVSRYHSVEEPLRLAYPDKFYPWSFFTMGKWAGKSGKQLAADATRWLLEERLHIAPTSTEITPKLLKDNGLGALIKSRQLQFGSVQKVIKNAYPGMKRAA